jgi:uncharacterized protein YqfA (UPF0365 family)
MRKSTRFISGLAMAGIVAAAGSAFTAQSDFDRPNQYVGAASQTISGVHANNVVYTVGADDTTTKVTVHVAEDLDVAIDKVMATITGDTTETKPCTWTNAATAGDGSSLTCAFTGVVNVTQLSIVAS